MLLGEGKALAFVECNDEDTGLKGLDWGLGHGLGRGYSSQSSTEGRHSSTQLTYGIVGGGSDGSAGLSFLVLVCDGRGGRRSGKGAQRAQMGLLQLWQMSAWVKRRLHY